MELISNDCAVRCKRRENVGVGNDEEPTESRHAEADKLRQLMIEESDTQASISMFDDGLIECLDRDPRRMAFDTRYHVMMIDQHYDCIVDNRRQSSETESDFE